MTSSGGMPPTARRMGAVVAVLVLAGSAVFAGDFFGMRTRLLGEEVPEPRAPASGREADQSEDPDAEETPEATRVRSNPWWQGVATLDGDGAATEEVAIDDDALQWRVVWECESGSLQVDAPGHDEPLVDARCPDDGRAFSTRTGSTSLDIEADGPWQLTVEQQTDVPLEEEPTPGMRAGKVIARGSFYDIDQTGRGEVLIYRLDDGSHELRLDDFFVTPNIDLEIRLSPQERPQTTEEFDVEASEYVDTLEPTTGSMNFTIPDDIDPNEYDSVVIWCPPVLNAYAAATLEPPE